MRTVHLADETSLYLEVLGQVARIFYVLGAALAGEVPPDEYERTFHTLGNALSRCGDRVAFIERTVAS